MEQNTQSTPKRDRWPRIIGLPSPSELERGRWVSECGSRGCLVGHVASAFHHNPLQHLPAGEVSCLYDDDGNVLCKFEGGDGLGKPAITFLRRVCIELGADVDAVASVEDEQVWRMASDLFEDGRYYTLNGVVTVRGYDPNAGMSHQPPSERRVSNAYQRAAAHFGYTVVK